MIVWECWIVLDTQLAEDPDVGSCRHQQFALKIVRSSSYNAQQKRNPRWYLDY